jgi:membrane protease YdiL (CAAX protease family)
MFRSLLVFPVMTGIILVLSPDHFLLFVKERPGIWLMVMALYPLLSALPQELIYRTFFFHRYKEIFKNETLMIWMSTVSFSYLHIIYDNWVAVILTFVGGYLFSKTYHDSKSLSAVGLEHAIYGNIGFTLGYGKYFYEGNG